MNTRNSGVQADPLFAGLTRPPLRWGVTDLALIVNAVLTLEFFLVSKNPLTLSMAAPIHGLCALLCARDVRFFHLAFLCVRTRLPAYLGNYRYWRSSSYSALMLDAPDFRGRRRLQPNVRVAYCMRSPCLEKTS